MAAVAGIFRRTGSTEREPKDGSTMRTWLLAVSALTLVALTSPLAGEKRSSVLAVRVNVVRSCSVNTESAVPGVGTVSCGTRFGPPVMSTNSTIALPVSAAPNAMIETTAVVRNQPDQPAAQSNARGVQPARQADVSAPRVTETVTANVPGATADAGESETVTIRVMTVNF
jgi:hypothetical protein